MRLLDADPGFLYCHAPSGSLGTRSGLAARSPAPPGHASPRPLPTAPCNNGQRRASRARRLQVCDRAGLSAASAFWHTMSCALEKMACIMPMGDSTSTLAMLRLVLRIGIDCFKVSICRGQLASCWNLFVGGGLMECREVLAELARHSRQKIHICRHWSGRALLQHLLDSFCSGCTSPMA